MHFKRYITVIICVILYISVSAQKESNIWYFGNQAGLDFNKTPVEAITNGQLYAKQGSASICTQKGRLLFYTDGYILYDSTHAIMPNGKDIRVNNNWYTTQSALILPLPDSKSVFYLFTTEAVYDTAGSTASPTIFQYSIIDMSLNSGKGDVVKGKRNQWLLYGSDDKLCGTQHANGKDYWILGQKLFFDPNETRTCDSIFAWQLTAKGIINPPVITKTGHKNAGGFCHMKISPDGTKIVYGLTHWLGDTLLLGDFDASTGRVSNIKGVAMRAPRGLEFSPNTNYLYAAHAVLSRIYQYNAQASSIKELLASKITIDSNSFNSYVSLQLAPDGKIYLTQPSVGSTFPKYLNVIHKPDSLGVKCKFQKDYIYLGGKSTYVGLPNFVSSFLKKVPLSIQSISSCLGDTTFFSIPYLNDPDSVKWDFGDTGSGNSNFSRSTEVYHLYKKQGNYMVTAIVYDENRIDTLYLIVSIKSSKPDFEAVDACEFDSIIFKNMSGFGSERYYNWKFGDGGISGLINPKHFYKINNVSRTYNVTLVSSIGNGCKDSISKAVTVNANPNSDFSYTVNQNSVDFKAVQPGNTGHKWFFGNGDSAASEDINYTYSKSGKYTACLKVINAASCFSETCKEVFVSLGISKINKPSGFKIYPNPTYGTFTIEIENTGKDISIEVYDMIGQLVQSVETSPYKNIYPVDFFTGNSSFFGNQGAFYLVRVKNNGITWNQKVFVSVQPPTDK